MKHLIQFLGILFSLVSLISCGDQPIEEQVMISYGYFHICGNDGENLLVESTEGYIPADSISMYYIADDGCIVPVINDYGPELKNGVTICTGSNGMPLLRVELDPNAIIACHYHGNTEIIESTGKNEPYTETMYLKYGTGYSPDTIVATFSWHGNIHRYDDIYINGVMTPSKNPMDWDWVVRDTIFKTRNTY